VIEAYPLSALYFMGVFLTVAVAVMNLILGVVVNVASSEHDRLHGELAEEKNMKKMFAKNDILRICEEMDLDHNGELSEEELRGFSDSEAFATAIEDLELTQEDLTIAFAGMDEDHSGQVSYKEFVHKLYKMKDSDSNHMMEQIKYLITQVRDLVVQTLQDETKKILEIEEAEKTEIEKLVAMEKSAIEGVVKLEENVEVLMHNMKPDGVKPTTDNKLDVNVVSGIQEKEQKGISLGWARTAEAVPGNEINWASETTSAGSLDLQNAAGGSQLSKDVLGSLLQAFSHFQVDFKDFRDSLKHLESSLEVHTSTTSKVLSRLVPADSRGNDFVALPSVSTALMPVSSKSAGMSVCCGGSVLPSAPGSNI